MSKAPLCFLLFLLTLGPVAQADVIHFHDGRRIEGEVMEENATRIIVKLRMGETSFERSAIDRIERVQPAWKAYEAEYQRRLQAARAGHTIAAWEDLASWCENRALYGPRKDALKEALALRRAEAIKAGTIASLREVLSWARLHKIDSKAVSSQLHQAILQLDPDDSLSRAALGHKRLGKRWHTAAEYPAAYEQHMISRGFVRFKGRWLTPEGLAAFARVLEAEAAKARVEQLERDNLELRRLNQRALAENRALAAQLRNAESELSSLRRRYRDACATITGLQNRNHWLEGQVRSLRQRLRSSGQGKLKGLRQP